MTIKNLIEQSFTASSPFIISKTAWQEESDCFQLCNKTLEKLKEKGIELHYEVLLGKETGKNVIRLDCHVFPYWRFKNAEGFEKAVKKYYSDSVAKTILEIREKLKEIYIGFSKTKSDGYDYGIKSTEDYLWLVLKDLAITNNEEELLSEIYRFIADTYPDLIKVLKNIGIY